MIDQCECSNRHACTCTKECERHGRCCDCVAHHISLGNLPACLR